MPTTRNENPRTRSLNPYDNDLNVVEIWTRVDPVRWIAGALAGLLAGTIALLFAMAIATAAGREIWFPVKLLATTVLGPTATSFDSGQGAIAMGLVVFEGICTFWGVVYAHFTGTNSLASLLPMGLVWTALLWVFNWCLFLQSFRPVYVTATPYSVAFAVCLVYGISLCSVAFFDQLIRGSGRSPGH